MMHSLNPPPPIPTSSEEKVINSLHFPFSEVSDIYRGLSSDWLFCQGHHRDS